MADLSLAIFDCDGTLLDGQHTVIEAMDEAWNRHGLGPVDPLAVRQVIGLNLRQGIARLVPDHAAGLVDDLVAAYSGAYVALRDEKGVVDAMYNGMAEVLDTLDAQGILLGIATGKSRRGLESALAAHGIADRFVTLQTPDVAKGKPHPDMIERAMSAAGVTPDRTVMIGDTSFDMEMARAAGVGALGVAWGYHPPDSLMLAGAHTIVDHPASLSAAIVDRIGA